MNNKVILSLMFILIIHIKVVYSAEGDLIEYDPDIHGTVSGRIKTSQGRSV